MADSLPGGLQDGLGVARIVAGGRSRGLRRHWRVFGLKDSMDGYELNLKLAMYSTVMF